MGACAHKPITQRVHEDVICRPREDLHVVAIDGSQPLAENLNRVHCDHGNSLPLSGAPLGPHTERLRKRPRLWPASRKLPLTGQFLPKLYG